MLSVPREIEMVELQNLYSEDAVAYSLHTNRLADGSRFLFKVHHNMRMRVERTWYYWCAPEIDVIEVKSDRRVIGYELKGARRYRAGQTDYPAIYDAIGQAVAYLDLPGVFEADARKFAGGVFDSVYLVCAREQPSIDESEKRILAGLPIGAMLALPDGKIVTVKEAPPNPIQSLEAKEHFLQNLDALEKHTTSSRIFRRIEAAGNRWFGRACASV
jgi:hypothetical protein